MIILKPTTLKEISIYIRMAEREGLTFCKNTELFNVYLDNVMVGFTGMYFYKNKVIFKNSFVFPQWRRRGIFRQICDWRIKEALNRGIKVIEATCTAKSLPEYMKRGFQIVHKYKSGVTKVRNEDISRSKRI